MVLFIKNYIFIKKIGQGSYGEVWLVRRKDHEHKKFVLKKISFARATDREMEAARQECQILKSLMHPNIVQYKDSFEEDNSLHIAMAYCEDGDLYTRLKDRKGVLLPENQIVEWLIQITMALSYIHERNILHRDLKTQNIFLAKSIIKIGDLGIAKQLESKYDMAKTIIGTPYYMSPELFAKKPYNFKSDIWSLGCVTYEMATLKHAFNAKNYSALSYKILNGQAPDIPQIYSAELISLIGDMLNKKPERRPHTGKILCNPFIRQHIEIYLANAKRTGKLERRRSSSKSLSQEFQKRSQDSLNVLPDKLDSKASKKKLSGVSANVDPVTKNKNIPAPLCQDQNQKDYTDNDDVVIIRSSNESQSKRSSLNNNKDESVNKNRNISTPLCYDQNHKDYNDNDDVVIIRSSNESKSKKSSPTSYSENSNRNNVVKQKVVEKENVEEVKGISEKRVPVKDDDMIRSKSVPNIVNDQISVPPDCKSANNIARERRRQKKRDEGYRTLLIGNDELGEKAEPQQNNKNSAGIRRRRRNASLNDKDGNNIVLPQLRKVDSTEELKSESSNQDELQVVEKMNETLNFTDIHRFGNIKDSIVYYKGQKDLSNHGPIENEQETLDRTKFQDRLYQEIRKEIMKNVGWEKVAQSYEILRNMDLNHDTQLIEILGIDLHKAYAGKIIWVKMVEEG